MAALLPSAATTTTAHPYQKLPPFLLPSPRPSTHRLSSPRHTTPLSAAAFPAAGADDDGDWPFEQRMREALHLLDLMQSQAMSPDPSLLCTLLQSCAEEADLELARTVHSRIRGCRSSDDVFVRNNLISMYAKCGDLGLARGVFDEMPVRNAVSWTTLISMHGQAGRPWEALRLYNEMKSEAEVVPNNYTLATVLNSCGKVGNLDMGVEVHEDVVRYGFEEDGIVITALIDMYAKCGCVNHARKVFDRMLEPSVSACTAMIEGYSSSNLGKEGLNVIRKVVQSSADVDIAKKLGFATLIKACVVEGALKQGQEVHCQMIKQWCQPGAKTLSALVLLYEKCDKMALAGRVFDELIVKDDGLWSKMAIGYLRNGLDEQGLLFYQRKLCEGVYPEMYVMSAMLDACASLQAVEEGKQIHGRIMKTCCNREYESPAVMNLVKMYYECDELDYVRNLLRLQRELKSTKISQKKTLIGSFAG